MTPSCRITTQGFSQKAHGTFADAPQPSHLFFVVMASSYKGPVPLATGDVT